MRIRHAAFPALKTLEDFDWSAQPSAEKPLVLHLAQLAWIEERANVCFFGPPGTGKTHCAIALAIKACERGYRVAFATAQEWVSRLDARTERRRHERAVGAAGIRPGVGTVAGPGRVGILKESRNNIVVASRTAIHAPWRSVTNIN